MDSKHTCRENIVKVSKIGRPPLNIPVDLVCDTVRLYPTVKRAAKALNCSRAYIYKMLKASGKMIGEVRG